MQSVILKTATRLMVGLIVIFAVYLLLRGHHEPGGGFAAALVAGTAIALFVITEGSGRGAPGRSHPPLDHCHDRPGSGRGRGPARRVCGPALISAASGGPWATTYQSAPR